MLFILAQGELNLANSWLETVGYTFELKSVQGSCSVIMSFLPKPSLETGRTTLIESFKILVRERLRVRDFLIRQQ